jgi:hypothetical protein
LTVPPNSITLIIQNEKPNTRIRSGSFRSQ